MSPVRRRQFLIASGALLAAPLARAQPARKPFRIGYAALAPLSALAPYTSAFEQGLRDLGLEPGRDVILDYRSANGDLAHYAEVVREVVGAKPDVIIAGNNQNTLALKAATQKIPIVMMIGTNVVEQGLAASLARPGGNITGLTFDVGPDVAGKRLQLIKEMIPRLKRFGVLCDVPFCTSEYREIDRRAAAALGLTLVERRDITDDFDQAFAAQVRERVDAVYIQGGSRSLVRLDEIAALSLKHRLPTVLSVEEMVIAGGLMSYGPSVRDNYRRAAGYVSKILKGAKPADLPIEQPMRLHLVINLKTAKALGITVPQSLLLRADRVIE
jgi:putative ABC transport system substrate-binding protein